MPSTYNIFKKNVTSITDYYTLLVEETKSQRLVGSTNEWVLDNYYMISEQEKVLREELTAKAFRSIKPARMATIAAVLQGFLNKNHFEVNKALLYRYITQVQVNQNDYLSYPEVCALLPLIKHILIAQLAELCNTLRQENAYHYKPTDKNLANLDHLDHAAKHNLMMMNIFNSLKKMTKLPMAEFIDAISFSERALKNEKAGMYDQMQDKTKDDYRAQIVRLCKKKKTDEHTLVARLIEESDAKNQHVGWLLFPEKRLKARAHLYIWHIVLITLALSLLAAVALAGWHLSAAAIIIAVLMLVPFSQIVIDVANRILYHLHKPRGTFKLKFKDGIIPTEYATMVIMPTILKNKEKTIELLEQLEVYYLSNINRDGTHLNSQQINNSTNKQLNLFYTLIGDAAAYGEADAPWDDEVAHAGEAKVRELNAKYGAPIFNFVYRRRAWSDGENCWLGHERKRGAILHFNDLLLGDTTTEQRAKRFRTETISQWREGTVPDIRFIITLDTDTELVLYSAQKLIGSMAHPLNQAQLSPDGHRVDRGYGIMQPRVNVDVEVTNKSRYAQLFAGLGGLDVYTTASFELYQDIFDEGSFCGKGIYDLRVFQHVLKGTFPDNLILSHDLLEGCHIRCGLINDVELFDDNPSNYIDDAKRHHRWTRGDWQIIAWLKNHVRNQRGERVKNQVNTIGRWKIFDNLRRSVLSLSTMILILVAFALGGTAGVTGLGAFWAVALALAAVASPIVFFILDQLTKLPSFGKRYHYYATLMRGFRVIVYRSLVQFALLPKEAWMYTDAALRACYRMWFSHKNLLNWITSDEAAKSTKGTMGDYIAKFWFNYVCSAAIVALMFINPHTAILNVIAALFCILLWCGAPFLMFWLGKKFPQNRNTLNAAEKEEIRQLANDTWNFFDSMLDEKHNWLIPDNYQIGREPLTDYKTSPTNIGYSITAVVCAAELGFIGQQKALTTLENIITTVEKLEKWNGHLFNWYGISTLKALPNFFISTADSGNFVACLYAAKGWLTQRIPDSPLAARIQKLIADTDFSKLYNHELDVFSIGYDYSAMSLLPYHYNNFASEARLTSFLTISQGDAPYKHWFCLDKTLVQYHGYKGVASWYGTMFEYFMPLIFLPTFKHTLMDETYSFAIRAQRAFMRNSKLHDIPWGISETAYNELDDARNYKYHAFGVPYLKFQNTTPDRIVVSPYSSLLAISANDRAVYNNLQLFKEMKMYDEHFGLFESYDQEDRVPVRAHYAHHQGMILAALTNYLTCDTDNAYGCLQRFFMHEPAMRSMETLLKEKAQVKPYIDLKITQYKRFQYSKVQTESDARDYDNIAVVPEIGFVSNGQYTVMMNDRGSGFSRYRNILMGRYRKISADHYGTYLYIRNLQNDRLWSATYAPLDVMPEGYHVSFASDKLTFTRLDDGIETRTEVTVLKDRSAEIRRFTFVNNADTDADLEITSYGEVVLCTADEDVNHRVFNGMKIISEYDAVHQALIFSRPGADDSRHYLLHKLWTESPASMADGLDPTNPKSSNLNSQLVEYETSRMKFLGRGNSLRHADVIESHRTLSGTVGTTLDPVMSMRRRIHIPAGKSAEAFIVTGFAKAKEQLLQLVEQYGTSADIEHAFKTSSVFNNMRQSMSLLKGAQMRLYCNIAKYMAQTATMGNRRNEALTHNTLSQRDLWRFGISGDLAILLLEVDSAERSGFAKEMLRAFEYFKVHGLSLDLVIINSAPENERDGLYHFIRNMADTEHLWASHNEAGKVFVINSNDLSDAERTLLYTVARITFDTHSRIEQQLKQLENENTRYQDKVEYPVLRPRKDFRVWSDLEFYNQYGGFDNGGRDYVVTNTNTPMPWVNVVANMGTPDRPQPEGNGVFGFVVSSTMAGFTFAHNAQQFKLTGWSNDIVRDNASEMLLIDGGQFVPATARHGQGFSAFDADYDDGLHCDVRLFVAMERMEKYYHIRLINNGSQSRTLNLDMVYKLVLGVSEEQTSRYLCSEWDEETQSILVRNVYHPIYRDIVVRLYAVEGDEGIAQQKNRVSLDAPNRKSLGFETSIPAGGQKEVAFVICAYKSGDSEAAARRVTISELYREFDAVMAFWDDHLSHIQVATPDPSFNHMVNRWYLYQVCSSRLFARAGFYQVGGATGYRDQLQDVMSLLYSDPGYARRQILDHAAHQFAEGDVLHWWHESLKMGARTTFSDDYLWLPYVTYQYVHITGDKSILNEQVPFCKGDTLPKGVNERGINYVSGTQHDNLEQASLYEHLRRAIGRSMSRIGQHGLPLMGCGDWNDGMSRVGAEGKGESVWVALFLCDLLPKMQKLTIMMPGADLSYCEELTSFRDRLVDALQRQAWDGNWFLRAFYDDGTPMGSRLSTECQIDLISQAWSILTDVATPEQKEKVMRETDARLVNREHEIIQLLTPAFDSSHPSQHNPGYISNYPTGVRENGGQYTHGAMWYIMAQLKEGRRDMAYYLYSIINPIHRTNSLADVLKYKVEPYCMAADIYSNQQHPGRGGWTWYTGSASWAYKTGIEEILGLRKEGDTISFCPNIPSDWNGFTLRYRHGNTTYLFHVSSSCRHSSPITLVDDGKEHVIDL